MATDLSNVQISFHTKRTEYEQFRDSENVDPEALAERRLEIIRHAKRCLEDKSSPDAVHWYGWCLVTGDEAFPLNVEEGIKYLNEAVMMRNSSALTALGDIYSGIINTVPGDLVDFDKAVKNYERASDLNEGFASYRLAEIYSGVGPVPRDIRKALDYVEKAEHQGNKEGSCLMAIWIFQGDYLQQDFEKAYNMFMEIVEPRMQDNEFVPECDADLAAYFHLGVMHFFGHGVQQDEEKGYNMIDEAALYGHDAAVDWMDDYHN